VLACWMELEMWSMLLIMLVRRLEMMKAAWL
jgi:hypothetical protein